LNKKLKDSPTINEELDIYVKKSDKLEKEIEKISAELYDLTNNNKSYLDAEVSIKSKNSG